MQKGKWSQNTVLLFMVHAITLYYFVFGAFKSDFFMVV